MNRDFLPIDQAVFDRCQRPTVFEDYQDRTLITFYLSALADTYSPHVCASFNRNLHLPQDDMSITDYDPCITTPARIPYYATPTPDSVFRVRGDERIIDQPKYTSLLPLLIAASRNHINIMQYNVISERNSLRKIAMNDENYVIGVQKVGSTLFLRRHDHRLVDMNDAGYRFEQMCTPNYDGSASYHRLIGGCLGDLATLITAETDAVSVDDKAIELKCRLNRITARDPIHCWLQAFLGKINYSH